MVTHDTLASQRQAVARVRVQMRLDACLSLALAVVFAFFFQITKHQPALAQVNPFANDPYDTVISFGLQFAAFAALLSVLRAFRPYPSSSALLDRQALLRRGNAITVLCVVITVLTDAVALLRYRSLWINTSAGQALAVVVVGMGVLAALVGWRVYAVRPPSTGPASSAAGKGVRVGVAVGLSVVSALVFGVYPPSFDRGYGGAILTVVIGQALFFSTAWAWTLATTAPGANTDDALDDIAAFLHWLAQRLGLARAIPGVARAWRSVAGSAPVRPIMNWLNPRRHAWNAIVLAGLLLGGWLAFAEFAGGPLPGAMQVIRVTLVFVGLECVGVLMGYAFFAGPLRLVRHDAHAQLAQRATRDRSGAHQGQPDAVHPA